MLKKILLTLGIVIILFAGINTAAALNSSILDAISGLPLSDQIIFVAKEVDRLKLKDELRDACDLAEDLNAVPTGYEGAHRLGAGVEEQVAWLEEWVSIAGGTAESDPSIMENALSSLEFFEERLSKYLVAKGDCDRLTEEFNQKYGD